MIRERLSELKDRAVEARLWDVAHVAGSFAVEGALGENGLDIMKTGKNGEQKIKKVKTARVIARAFRNPLGVARSARQGVAQEARHAVTSRGLEATRAAINEPRSDELVGTNTTDSHNVSSQPPISLGESVKDFLPSLPPLPGENSAHDNGGSDITSRDAGVDHYELPPLPPLPQ